jgi:Fe-S-cluster containining protein
MQVDRVGATIVGWLYHGANSFMAKTSYFSAEARAEPFGFVCSRCSHCCHDKLIQMNPYEIARLAANRGVGTAQFRARWTQDGEGLHIARTESGACVFLGPQGCTVHPDRPLVCRLYPLGRQITASGGERFVHVAPHPLSGGTFHTRGTIADFLAAQDVEDFIQAADDYFSWFCRARDAMAEAGEGDPALIADANELLDMDSAIAAHCLRTGEEAPFDIEERRRLHLAILDQALAEIEGSQS